MRGKQSPNGKARVNPGNTGRNQNTRNQTRQDYDKLLSGLHRVAIARRVINAIQNSAITERKCKAYKECANGNQLCVISAISGVCVVSAMDDGNCSPWVTCNS